MSEAELQRTVLEMAQSFRWLRAHFRPAMTMRGFRTPVEGDGAGFPDLILVREGRLVVAELKAAKGELSIEQTLWLTAFSTVPCAEVHVIRPEHLDDGSVESLLR